MLPVHFKPFQPGSRLPATPKWVEYDPQIPPSDNDKTIIATVRPLHGKVDLQLKTIHGLMNYYHDCDPAR